MTWIVRTARLLLVILVFAGAVVPMSTLDSAVLAATAQDEDRDSDAGEAKDDKDDEDKDEGKNRDAEEEQETEERGTQAGTVASAQPYRVEVGCEVDEAASQTTCVFTGVAPPEAKDVSYIVLPTAELCTDVIGGDAEAVDPDPNTHITGYKSRGSRGEMTLLLTGRVTTEATATYWFKTGDGVFPATGPDVRCGDEEGQEETVRLHLTGTPPVTPEVSDSTGAVVVHSYVCPGTPPDPTAFDWYGMCALEGVGRTFELTPLDAAADGVRTVETTSIGEGRFGELSPGSYRLEEVDGSWCHAESNNVTDEGVVVVAAGQRTLVWLFHCEGS